MTPEEVREFKDYLKSKGYDWERNISRFAAGRLDLALQMAKEVAPTLTTDVIRTFFFGKHHLQPI